MADLKFKVAVSTGLFGIARAEEIATVVRKIGYALTRGTSAIEVAGDVPHEIDYTDGWELRYIAEKQGLDINLHGYLDIPFCIPERLQWREAQDRVRKSIKSAVYGGCKYVNFHSCRRFWVEMLTYVGARLEIVMCDWKGDFISEILYEKPKLREFFIEHFWDRYEGFILESDVRRAVWERARRDAEGRAAEEVKEEKIPMEELRERTAVIHEELIEEYTKERLREKLSAEKKEDRRWTRYGERHGDLIDACMIVANYLFITQDQIWKDMVEMYRDVLEGPPFSYDPEDEEWLFNAYNLATELGGKDEKDFKEFYYGVIGAKFLWGHLIEAAEWMAERNEFEGKGLPTIIKDELGTIKPPELEEEKEKLLDILKNMIIAIETPDAREPAEAGRYMLWHPKQVYVAVKNTREELKRIGNPYHDKVMMIIDFEHIATQGVDPLEELKDLVEIVPDVGRYIICVHSNRPNPLHSHFPIELGDELIYELLWILMKAGMGKDHLTYILFERGGFKDPFKRSVTALRLMVKYLEKNVPKEELPLNFYGISPRGLLAQERQWVTVFQHAMDPLKGTLKVPEEEFTFLGRAATEAGKRREEWEREEYR